MTSPIGTTAKDDTNPLNSTVLSKYLRRVGLVCGSAMITYSNAGAPNKTAIIWHNIVPPINENAMRRTISMA